MRLLSFGMLLCVALWAAACGKDPSLSCEADTDCEAGYQCLDGLCELKFAECVADDDCGEAYLRCSTDGMCIERTSCESSDECASGKVCSSGSCVERECRNDSECSDPAQRCQEGICRNVPLQCSRAGGTCDPSMPNHLGFGCADLGNGPTCYTLCERGEETDAQTGQPRTIYQCTSNHVCVTSGVADPVCRPSECTGYFDGQATCATIAANDPGRFPNGAHCARAADNFGNTANLCLPAGTGEQGAPCGSVTNCASGNVCLNYIPFVGGLNAQSGGTCGAACNSDSDCPDGLGCIGNDDGLYGGVGVCGDRCNPYEVGNHQCEGELGCMPVSSEDGVCFATGVGEKEMYDACTPSLGLGTDGCPSGSWCFPLGGQGADEGRCTPYCDPSSADPDATCPSGEPKAYFSLMHFVRGAGPVDIHVNGQLFAEGVDFGDVVDDEGDFFATEPGDLEIVIAGEPVEEGELNVLFETTLNLGDNGVAHIVLVPETDEESEALLQALNVAEPRNAALPVGDTAVVRLVHGLTLAGAVDVIAMRDGATFETPEIHTVLAENLAFGDVSAFATLETDLGEATQVLYNVYVFEAGTERTEENVAAAVMGFELATDDMFTLYITGEMVDVDVEVVNPEDPDGDPIMETIEELAIEFVAVPYRIAGLSRALGGYCYNLSDDGSRTPGLGFCFEKCTTTGHFAGDACSGSGIDACNPVGAGMGWCFPAGQGEEGGNCSEDSDCSPGLFCDPNGVNGTCRSYCEPNEQINEALSCGDGEACFAIAGYDNLGECRIPCEPGEGYIDESCPENQQTCYESNGQSFCRASGTLADGLDCGSPTLQNCAPGHVCAKNGSDLGGVLLEPFRAPGTGETATCRQICEPFTGEDGAGGCPSDMRCSSIMPGNDFSTTIGHCVELGERAASLEPCSAIGTMCGENSYCIDNGGTGLCVQLCDYFGQRGCTDGTRCNEWSETGALLDVYGICQ